MKPILGCEVYVAPRSRTQRDARLDKEQYHLVLLAKTEKGYKNLIKLVSIAFSEGFYYKPRVDKELLAQYSEDLIALTGCLSGEVPRLLLRSGMDQAERSLAEYIDIFGKENLYLELQENGIPEQKPVNEALIRLSRQTGLKLVASNDIHYTFQQRRRGARRPALHPDRLTRWTIPSACGSARRSSTSRVPEEMARALRPTSPARSTNTLEIAERCNIKFDFGRPKLPDPASRHRSIPSDHMETEAWKGLADADGRRVAEDYQKQFDYECGIIRQCGFATYMLIVRDFTDFARGRGSTSASEVRRRAASSATAWGSPMSTRSNTASRSSDSSTRSAIEMPDVDLDIQDDRRDELIQYVCEKYGRDRVGQIATFGSLKARAAVRDCGRVLGMDLGGGRSHLPR